MNKHPQSDGLRAIADYFDALAANGVAPTVSPLVITTIDGEHGDRPQLSEADAIRAIARLSVPFERKDCGESCYEVVKEVGGVAVRFIVLREATCERVVVGTKLVPETVVPAKEAQPAEPERIIPAHEVEQVEWRCHSLLADPDPGLPPMMVPEDLAADVPF